MSRRNTGDIHAAARSGDLPTLQSILASNPLAVNSRDKHSRTPYPPQLFLLLPFFSSYFLLLSAQFLLTILLSCFLGNFYLYFMAHNNCLYNVLCFPISIPFDVILFCICFKFLIPFSESKLRIENTDDAFILNCRLSAFMGVGYKLGFA